MTPHLEVAMLSRGISCTANCSNSLHRRNNISHPNEQVVVMSVKGLKTSTMIKDHGFPVAAHRPAIDNFACCCGGHGLSVLTSNIHPRVPVTTTLDSKG